MLRYCTLASSSSGNSAYLTDGETGILIDLGISTRAAERELSDLGVCADEIDAVLITHEHGDHVRGLVTWQKKHPNVKICAPKEIGAQLFVDCEEIPQEEAFTLGSLTVTAFPTPHDTAFSVGYRVEAGGHVVVSMTDLGCVADGIYPYLEGVELLLIEANYDPDRLRYGHYPEPLKRRIASEHGHLSNPDCAVCALRAASCGAKTILLGHLSKENNTPRLAYETVHAKLTQNGLIPGVDVMLSVAPREGHSEWYTLE